MSREMWDQRYASEEYVYGTAPNLFFEQTLRDLTPGTLLLPAEGEGRNAVFAAGCGWKVSAFDQSVEARSKALKLAAEKGVEIDYTIGDLEHYSFPEELFDAIALIFVHMPGSKRRALHRKFAGMLKPGGTLILAGFAREQVAYSSGGPKDESMLFSLEELKQDFEGLEIRLAEHLETELSEGDHHKGTASVIHMLVVRP